MYSKKQTSLYYLEAMRSFVSGLRVYGGLDSCLITKWRKDKCAKKGSFQSLDVDLELARGSCRPGLNFLINHLTKAEKKGACAICGAPPTQGAVTANFNEENGKTGREGRRNMRRAGDSSNWVLCGKMIGVWARHALG